MDKTTMTKLYPKVFALLRQQMKTVDYMTFEQSLLETINKSNKGLKEHKSNNGYNGYANWETWVTVSHLENNETIHNVLKAHTLRAKNEVELADTVLVK